MNEIQLTGNLIEDPRFRTTKNNIAIARLKIAVDIKAFNKNATPEFFTVNCWGRLADRVLSYQLQKGDFIYVKGRIKTNSFVMPNGETYRDKEVKALVVMPM